MSVSISLADDIDIGRGDMIVGEDDTPAVSQDIELMVMTRGEIRTLDGYARLFSEAGLKIAEVTEIPCPFMLHAVEAVPD